LWYHGFSLQQVCVTCEPEYTLNCRCAVEVYTYNK